MWDAFERLKTVEPGNDKIAQVNAIFNKAATEPNFVSSSTMRGSF
jgi:hypothetical protein